MWSTTNAFFVLEAEKLRGCCPVCSEKWPQLLTSWRLADAFVFSFSLSPFGDILRMFYGNAASVGKWADMFVFQRSLINNTVTTQKAAKALRSIGASP